MSVWATASRLSIRSVLWIGFGITLCLWLFSALYFSRRLSELQQHSTQVTARYVRAQAQMSAVRNQVLLASVLMRDVLLDAQSEPIPDYRMELEKAFRITARLLAEYEPVLDSERSRVQQLRAHVDDFQHAILQVLESDSTRWRPEAHSILGHEIVPKREQAVTVSDDVESIDRRAYTNQQAATTEFYRGTQQRIWTPIGLTIGASFFIGLVAVRHVAAMESELRCQQRRDAKSSAELRRLSAQLIGAQQEERRAIARELHDEIGQALTAIKIELALMTCAAQKGEHLDPSLHTVRDLTDGALNTVRDLSRLLRPAVLDDVGLAAALHAYVRDFRRRCDTEVEFEESVADLRLSSDTETAAYRIVQEALTNVARHSRASSCRVTLHSRRSAIEISIEDNGIGFDVEAQREDAKPAGLGLLGMRERAARLDGSCVADSTPGHGTRVTIKLPLQNQATIAMGRGPAGTAPLGQGGDA